jgi:hypothetical protein
MKVIVFKISLSNASNHIIKWLYVIPVQLITWLVLYCIVEMLFQEMQIKPFLPLKCAGQFNLSIGVLLDSNLELITKRYSAFVSYVDV